jgi:hypothetical protein
VRMRLPYIPEAAQGFILVDEPEPRSEHCESACHAVDTGPSMGGIVGYIVLVTKVTQEVAATGDGTLVKIFVAAGEIAAVGAPVCAVDMQV